MNETKGNKGRYIFLLILLILVVIGFAVRLFNWQILNSDYYNQTAVTTSSYKVNTEAIRGEIFDVNGMELAVNITNYKVTINALYMKDKDLNKAIVKLVNLIEGGGEKWIDVLPIYTETDGSYAFSPDKEDEIAALKSKDNLNMNSYATAEECMARLIEKYECSDYNKKQQRDIISVRYNMQQSGYNRSNPYTFAEGISENMMLILSENFPSSTGVAVETTATRTYVNGTVAPHLVGITGKISQDEYEELKNSGYSYNDIIGKSGIESALESNLRGTAGYKRYEVSSNGEKVKVIDMVNAQPGDSVYLTIDAKYQKTAQRILQEAVQEAHEYAASMEGNYDGEDCLGGSIVVLNIKDFSVLCAATYPSYDLANYYTDYTKLVNDKGLPLFNRAFQSALAPGSTFKPMVAAAALQEKAITTSTAIDCTGIYTGYGLQLRCMGYHPGEIMRTAIVHSCNYFFAEAGRRLGIDKMNTYAKRCGLGVYTGVEIFETAGILAGPENNKKWGTDWYESSVCPAAIGQSDNAFSTLQLATYAATLANNGVRLRTHIVRKVVSYDGTEVVYENDPDNPEVVDNMGVSKINLNAVKEAMNEAGGNYLAFQDFDIPIAGKTGTAENAGSDHSNFICFAPYDNPQIAVAVMVEHGAKSSVATNAAEKFLRAYFYGEGLATDTEKNITTDDGNSTIT